MAIPQVAHGEYIFWERIHDAQEVPRVISGRTLRFFVQPTRADSVHACTIDDIAHLVSHLPAADWEGLEAIALRQPRRKEQTLASVWGRLAYAAELVNSKGNVLYSGPAIILEAVDPTEPLKFGKALPPDGLAELERLKSDGHKLRRGDRNHTFDLNLEGCRSTQLYRTLPHELGHWVDFIEKVERPSLLGDGEDSEQYGKLLERYHGRPTREKEQFAHSYAERLRRRLIEMNVIPFSRQLDCQQLLKDKLRLLDFAISEVPPT